VRLYHINKNIPGCLPDNEGVTVEDPVFAADILREEIVWYYDTEWFCECGECAEDIITSALQDIPPDLPRVLAHAPIDFVYEVYADDGNLCFFVQVVNESD
jgi:hypothetical protein